MRLSRRKFNKGLAAVAVSPAVAIPGQGGGAAQTIASISPSSGSVASGVPSGTVIAPITVTMSPVSPAFSGTVSLPIGGSTAQITNGGNLPCNLETLGALADGTYSGTIRATQGGISNSPKDQPFTFTVGALTTSVTLLNTAGSPSGTDTPFQISVWAAKGNCPTGSIMEPSVGGVALTRWQVDNRVYWDDGSLRMGVCRGLLPTGIAAGSTQQIVWTVKSGTWPNTSSNTTADITGASDFKIALTNLSTAGVVSYASGTPGAQVGLTLGGGAITGGVVHYNNGFAGTVNVTGGRGTGGQVSISGNTITVVAPGSGYAYEGTAGSFGAGFNRGVTDAVYVKQYAKGPVCDAWEVCCPFRDTTSDATLGNLFGWFFIERWKNSSGAFLTFRASAKITASSWDTIHAETWYTYDCDWKNGSTVIRGASIGSTYYDKIQHWRRGAVPMVDSGLSNVDFTAKPDWTVNDTAYKSIIPQLTPTECDQFKNSKVLHGLRGDINPTVAVPTQQAFGSLPGATDIGHIPIAAPMGYAGLRVGLDAGGSDPGESLIGPSYALHWMNLRHSNLSAARTWLAYARGVAAAWCSTPYSSAFVEPTTFLIPCRIPASEHVFTGMIQTHYNEDAYPVSVGGVFPDTVGNVNQVASDTVKPEHLFNYILYPYILEGDQWILHSLRMMAGEQNFYWKIFYHVPALAATFGGPATYWGVGAVPDNRVSDWWVWTNGAAAACMPTTWADGSANVEQAYLLYTTNKWYKYLNDLYPYVGNQTYGSASGVVTAKNFDWSTSGYYNNNGQEIGQQFMDNYGLFIGAAINSWLGSNAPQVQPFLNKFKLYLGGRWQGTGTHYWASTYITMYFVGINYGCQYVPVTRWNDTNPVTGDMLITALSATGASMALIMENGNPDIRLCPWRVVSNGGEVLTFRLDTGEVMADGTKVHLTTSGPDTDIPDNTYGQFPTPFSFTTFYYMKKKVGDNTKINLYSDSAMTHLVTPTQDFNCMPDCIFSGFIDDGSGGGTYSGVAGTVLTFTALSGLSYLEQIRLDLGTIVLRDQVGGVTTGTTITSQLSGTTGGPGTYRVSSSQAIPPRVMTAGRQGSFMVFHVLPANTPPADNSGAGIYGNGVQIEGRGRLMESWQALAIAKWFGMDDTGANISQGLATINTMLYAQPGFSNATLAADPYYSMADGTIYS